MRSFSCCSIVAVCLGLPFVPPYLGRNKSLEGWIHGVNYASATTGRSWGKSPPVVSGGPKLYDSSVRKVVVMGMAPMGCSSHYMWKYNSTNGECIHEVNDMIMEFNYGNLKNITESGKLEGFLAF